MDGEEGSTLGGEGVQRPIAVCVLLQQELLVLEEGEERFSIALTSLADINDIWGVA